MKRKYSGTTRDDNGNIVTDATIAVYLSDTSAVANIYLDADSDTATTGTTSNSYGRYEFFVSSWDYDFDQTFKIIISKTGYVSNTIDNITIEDVVEQAYAVTADKTVSTQIYIPKGVTITVSTGKTLTFSGTFEAGCYQVFDGVGTVVFSCSAKEVYPEWFGAKSDGSTESALAIRYCADALSSGGSILLHPGSYYLDSYHPTLLSTDEWACIKLPSNVKLCGSVYSSTSLKLSATLQDALDAAKGVGQRLNIIGTMAGTSGQIVQDLKFDYNGIVLDIAFRNYNAVRAKGGKILIERLYVKDAPGRNMIVGTTDVTVRDCTFINGCQNVTGNTVADDCSFVYLEGANNLVENCSFTNDVAPVTNCGGVEIHATNSVVRNNVFDNLYPAIYVGIQDYVTIANNNRIEGNKITNCIGGIAFVDRNTHMIIEGNYFSGCTDAALGSHTIYTQRADIDGTSTSGIQDSIHIINNTFDNDDIISFACLQNSIISNNVWKKAQYYAINLLSCVDFTCKNIKITDNLFIDPPGFATYTVAQVTIEGSSDWDSVYSDIIIENNLFVADRDEAAPTNQYAIAATGAVAKTTMTNVVARMNEIVNMGAIGGAMAAYVILGLPSITLSTYADNAAALAGGLVAGQTYRTVVGVVMVTYTP